MTIKKYNMKTKTEILKPNPANNFNLFNCFTNTLHNN